MQEKEMGRLRVDGWRRSPYGLWMPAGVPAPRGVLLLRESPVANWEGLAALGAKVLTDREGGKGR